MRIQHNIMAMNAYRNYNTNTSALSKNLEKLSSGYKINRAGDDAAGLAISEKMRAQITGLNAAQKNVKDGISLVKTAEGAMQEIQDMLNRMDYLATQSANGTYQNEVDRENLNKEMSALKEEINRIADSANFNGIKLLDGSLDKTAAAANNAAAANAAASTGFADKTVTAMVDAVIAKDPQALEFEVDLSNLEINFAAKTTVGSATATITIAGQTFTVTATGVGSTGKTLKGSAVVAAIKASAVGSKTIGSSAFTVTQSGSKLVFKMKSTAANIEKYKPVTLTASVTVAASAGTFDKGFTAAVNITQAYEKGGQVQHAQGKFELSAADIKDGAELRIGDEVYTFKVGKDGKATGDNVINLTDYEEGAADINVIAATRLSELKNPNADYTMTADGKTGTVYLTVTDDFLANSKYDTVDVTGANATGAADATWKTGTGSTAVSVVQFRSASAAANAAANVTKQPGKLVLQIGDTSDPFNQLTVNVGDMHTKAMGKVDSATGLVTGKTINDIDILNPENASKAIDVIKGAINYVSSIRGDLGAVQNRLEHTANNLSVMAENIQDAESTIRDTDVAEEMMAYTKNNILIQSAQAMLAQANAVPQGVLQLLG